MFGKVVCDKAACEGGMRKIVQLCVTKLCVCVTGSYLKEMDSLAAWMSPNATRATENRRSNTVHVAKCHACHATASRGPARGPAATTHPAAPPEASVYCACHTTASRGPATTTRAAAPPGSSVYCACHTTAGRVHQLLQEALCTAPATRQPAAGQRRPRAQQLRQEALCTVSGHARSSSSKRLCVLRFHTYYLPEHGLLVASLAAIPGKAPGLLR